MKQRFLSILFLSLVFVFILFQNSPLFASDNNEIIRVGYTPNDDLIIDITNSGDEGYGYEVLKKVEELSDIKFEFIKIEDNIFQALDNGQVDIIGFYFHTPERAKKYLYVKTPLNAVQTALIAPTTQNRIYDNPESINGKTVATYEGNVANISLDNYLEKHNISVNYIMGHINDYKELEADYYLAYSSDADLSNYNNLLNFEKRNTYLLSLPDKAEMVEKLNDVINEIVTTEGNFFELLSEKYMGAAFHTFHRSLTNDELQTLRQRPLKIAYNDIASPLTYTNDEGKPDGALIDVMNKLIEIYNFDVEYYPYSPFDPSKENILENCDIELSIVGDMDFYEEHFIPSEAYYNIPVVAMVPRYKIGNNATTEEILKSAPKIWSLAYLYTDFDNFTKTHPENSYVFYENIHALFDGLEKNEVDQIITTQISLAYANSYLSHDDFFTYTADFSLEIHLSIAKDIAREYIPLFNVMLDNISEKEYQEILTQNQTYHIYVQSFSEMLLENWYLAVIIAFITASIILYIALYNQRKRRQQIQQAYETDSLTSLMTLNKFIEEAKKQVTTSESNTFELISFDIDMFKSINDNFGEEKGTQVIVNIAEALKEAFKECTVFLCRKVDEHFLVIRRAGDCGTVQDVCNNHIIPSIHKVVGEQYNLSLSFGMLKIDEIHATPSSYLAKVEYARAKGKNEHHTTFINFDEALKKDYVNKLNVTYRMKDALKNREFSVVYQPKIDFKSLQVGGAEALVRWFPKEGNTIFPDQFIPVFEQNGFILSLDLYVLEDVCRFIAENINTMNMPKISVNLSAHSILEDNLIERVTQIIEKHKINPEKIEFELTESAVEKDPVLFLKRIQELKNCGFFVSIDDFGAGVSSLNRLSSIDAHVLKLDKAFFDTSATEEKNKVVVHNVIRMAKELDMMIVAEGVETKEQALWLRKLDSDYAQGYYFAKPMDENSFRELLQSNKIYSLD